MSLRHALETLPRTRPMLWAIVLMGVFVAVGCRGSGECRGAGCFEDAWPSPPDSASEVGSDAGGDVAEIVTGSVCSSGETDGCATARDIYKCAPDGESFEVVPCRGSEGDISVCLAGACTECVPGARKCTEDETVVVCEEDGMGWALVQDCDGPNTGRICVQGNCVLLCEEAGKLLNYMGCEYWAVDLDNAFVECGSHPSGYCDAQGAPYAVVVSNPHPSWSANVKIQRFNAELGEVEEVTMGRDITVAREGIDMRDPPLAPLDLSPIPPGQLRVFYLVDGDVDGTVQAPLAFRITSNIPITAYQFNPLDNVQVFSNDASLLLPSNVLGRYHIVMTREQSFDRLRSYATVVATAPGLTRVSVTVSAHTLASTDGSIPPLAPGDTLTRVLDQYDVLNIETDRIGDDMTGTIILSDREVAVFGGSEASNAPNLNHCIDNPDYEPGDETSSPKVCEWDPSYDCERHADCSQFIVCCADHLEQQLFPVKTWGRRYLATRSFERGEEADNWRIIAANDNTRVTTIPPQTSIPVLNTGEWYDFESRQHFEIEADKPIMVGQFLQGEHAPGPGAQPGVSAGTGDPAFILAVPVEQFREDYVFLTPDKYAYNYVNVIAPRDTEVIFDGRTLEQSEFVAFGRQDYQVARFHVSAGVHTLTASEPVSVIVYGYDRYVSYGYPAGLNLKELNPEPGMQ